MCNVHFTLVPSARSRDGVQKVRDIYKSDTNLRVVLDFKKKKKKKTLFFFFGKLKNLKLLKIKKNKIKKKLHRTVRTCSMHSIYICIHI
jgi:hypothetical protein